MLSGKWTEPIAQAQVQPSSSTTIFENVTLSPNFAPDPITVRGISGGSQTASDLTGRTETSTGACVGYVDTRPDHTIVLTSFFDYLSLEVQSPENTTLVIRGPGGVWCNDIYAGQNPGIVGQWFSGTYEVWVGSSTPDTYHPYVIRISGIRPTSPQPTPPISP
ncbi:hypothetical protein C7B76_21400 [filamentous cyanobacterium CCP2]|nr:hypothetical protein C7B76_21400 [filamentous cyanobacterium CCP2]